MKPLHPILQVFLKEGREMLRDKRVRFSAFVMPIVISFMMISLVGVVASSVGKNAQQTIYLVNNSPEVSQALQSNPNLKLQTVPTEDAGIALIKNGKARLVLEFSERDSFGRVPIKEMYDPKEDTSQVAKAALEKALQPEIDAYQKQQLSAHGLTKEAIQPFKFVDSPVKVGEGGAGVFVVSLLPYLLIIFTFSGGINFAGDIVAGEKEKSTLETLLISPVPRTDIVLGKFLALCAICLASGMSSIISLALAASTKSSGSDVLFSGGLGFTPKVIGLLIVLILPLVAFFSGMLIAVSSFARNIREAQSYLGLVYMIVLIPAVFSQILGVTDFGKSMWINFVPVLNTAANIRTLFQGKPSMAGIAESVGVGVVLAAIMLWVAVRLFNREQVLDRT